MEIWIKSCVFCALVILLGFGVVACSDDEQDFFGDMEYEDGDGDIDGDSDMETVPQLVAVTTVSRTLVPVEELEDGLCAEPEDKLYCENPAVSLQDLTPYENVGMGEWEEAEGLPFTLYEDLVDTSADDRSPRSLLVWAQLSDVHITDEESPIRIGLFDNQSAPGGLRTQDPYSLHLLDAAVNTINAFNEIHPIDLVMVTGDISDSMQKNEIENAIAVLTGGPVDPDSGADDDPVAGEGNDPQDPFTAVGLGEIPLLTVLGNHDEAIIGTTALSDGAIEDAMGDNAKGGTRNGQSYELVTGEVVADAERKPLLHNELIQAFYNAPGLPQGHGFSDQHADDDQGYFVYDPSEDVPLRIIALDTGYRPQPWGPEGQLSYAEGVLDRVQIDDFLIPELDRAQEEKKLVFVVAHHPLGDIGDDGFPERYAKGDEVENILFEYPNVVLYLAGHRHENDMIVHANPDGGGFFEVHTASLIDWPQQFRMFELADNGDGTLSVFSAAVDHQEEVGSFAETARRLSLIDIQSGWGEGDAGMPEVGNVELVWPIPAALQDSIAQCPAASDTMMSQQVW